VSGGEGGGQRVAAEWVVRLVLVAALALYIATVLPRLGAGLSTLSRLLFVPLGCAAVLTLVWRVRTGRPPDSRIRFGRTAAAPAVKHETFGRRSSRVVQAIGLVAILSLVVSLAISPGTPVRGDGLYFIVNHSERSAVSEYTYLVARSWQTRSYLSGVALVAIFLLMYLDEQRDREEITEG
jgi:Na+/proline symporter